MKTYNTANLNEQTMRQLSPDEAAWCYNGLDCCVTFEVLERLKEDLAAEEPCVQRTYADSMAKQAPILDMQLRGIKIDFAARDRALKEFEQRLAGLDARFQRLCSEIFGYSRVNWKSPLQMKGLFYESLGHKEIKARNSKGVWAATTNEDAMNKLRMNFWCEPFANYVLAMRDISKKMELLTAEIDPDGRIRTSLNVAGTNTGRLASSASAFGSGRNLQNIDTTLRYPFVADDGYILVNVDLEQADARNVGALLWQLFYENHGPEEAGRYLDAAESGDLHTAVTQMCWQELQWQSNSMTPREVADQIAYRDKSYRDLAKALGHGSNYLGQPHTMAIHTHTDKSLIEDFQRRYFKQFPLIQEWHKHTIEQVKDRGVLTTPYGRRRHFFGRGQEATTHREAIAYCPQSMTGHQIDMGLLNLWRNMPEAQLLIQVHDSILFQVPFNRHEELVPQALELIKYPIELKGGRVFSVPVEAQLGWNWGKENETNPYGLMKWKGREARTPPKYLPRRSVSALLA